MLLNQFSTEDIQFMLTLSITVAVIAPAVGVAACFVSALATSILAAVVN